MRKLYFLMLLFTGLTGFAFSPPVIQNPTSLTICQGSIFSLHSKDSEILGALNPALFTINYFESNSDANSNINPIPNPDTYLPNASQIIYVRVEDNANPTVDYSLASFTIAVEITVTGTIVTPDQTVCSDSVSAIVFQGSGGAPPYTFTYSINGGANQTIISSPSGDASFVLPPVSGVFDIVLINVQSLFGGNCSQILSNLVHIIVTPSPAPNPPVDLSVEDIPFDGSAVFDLTSNDALLINGQSGAIVAYYLSLVDAQNAVNQIPNEAAFAGTNGQVIWSRVQIAFGCSVVQSFTLYVTNPNIVFIPDPYFKEELILASPTVDTNSDGEIQVTEALAYTHLTVDGTGITSLEGINSFTNLTHLGLGGFYMSTMDISGLTNLTELFCDDNQFTSLDVSHSVNLQNLQCANNNLSSINISGLTQLKYLSCYLNELTAINVAGLTTLESLDCRNNQLTSLDLSGLTNLQILNCNTNLLTTLDASQSPNLLQLACGFNPIATLDVSPYPNLTYLACGSPELNTVDVSSLVNLTTFYMYGSQQTSLDISNSHSVFYTLIHDCPNLDILNIKNGYATLNFDLHTLPNVNFICANESNINLLNAVILNASNNINSNAVINTYCSFNPGGNYNTINGSLIFDGNNNGCDASDSTFSNIRVNMTQWGINNATFSNSNGIYTFYTTFADQSVTPQFENATFFNVSPQDAPISFPDNNNNTATQNFCITANGVHPDVEVVVAPITPARPGFDAVYQITYKNKGNQIVNGVNTFTYDDTKIDFVSASQNPDLQETGNLYWDFGVLQPFEARSLTVTMHVHAPTDSFPVNIGDQLVFNHSIITNPSDENITDNTFQYNQTVVGSYDPNDITCLEGTIAPPSEIGNYLHYIINFENTGNADAINIVVKNIIDMNKFDVSSLQILNSSDPVTANIKDNTAEFIFQNINLHSGGHGNILLKVKTKNTLVEGDIASKRADIFFDYNFPVDTGFANTTFQALNNHHFNLDNSINVYPNPTKDNITIKGNFTFKSVQLYDVQGRILQTKLLDGNNAVMDLSSQQNGIYFVKVFSDKGIKVEKISKE